MAEEFQGGVCGGNWWNSSGNLFRSSPCSSAINGPGSFGWFNHHDPAIDMKIASRSISDDSAGSASDGTGSIVLQDTQKPSHETLQMMGISFSSTDDWNQNLLQDSGKSEQNYPQMLQLAGEGFNSSMNNYGQNNTDDFSDSINSFRQVNQNFRLNSDSYSYTSSLLQNLFDDTEPQPQQSTNYLSSQNNYQMNSNDFLPKQQPATNNHLQFTNNTPFWNATSASFVPSVQPQLRPSSLSNAKPNLHSFSAKRRNEESGGLNSVAPKKVLSNEPVIKRPRIETPSPLPTFKVRKEKLGDRVTALQQLVSPFGKTDTASVLHEAIEYIKFLHDQVSVLSTPYLKNGSPQLQRQQSADKSKDDQSMQDLRRRGLCLVPISSTFPVTAENTTHDFWTPTFGGCFR